MAKRDKNNEAILINVEKCTGCLNCQLICSFVFEKTFNPEAAHIVIAGGPGNRNIYFSDECTECNLCALHCVYGTLQVAKEVGQ